MNLAERIAAELPEIVEIRHDLHAHPELGYQEVRTSGVVQRELTNLGVKNVPGLAGGTGVLAHLPSTVPNARTIALRADMDALPIVEKTGVPYKSTHEGRMHACGHDGHTSILLGVARVLSKLDERPNNVLLLFQPAEEGGGGGKKMVDDGALAGTVLGSRADMIFGLHGYPGIRVGQIATRVGAMMASADGFEILVTGKGGHAAMPHTGVDPVVVASHIVTALQTIASRNLNPLDSVVVTIGKIAAGTASNIIPDTALLVGTLRTLNEATRRLAMGRIDAIASGVAGALGAKAELSFNYGYPVTCNDASAVRRLRETLAPVFERALIPEEVEPVMGAEDFSFYGAECPACFYWLGLLGEQQEQYPNLHAPEFDFNDHALPVGMRAMCELALSSK